MDLNRLKIEHCNSITAELAKIKKSDENMMSYYALKFMESNDEGDRISYLKCKAKCEAMTAAIKIAQTTSRNFMFDDA